MDKKFFINTGDLKVKSSTEASSDSITIAGYANTSDRDRANEIVKPEAWTKGVDNFRTNPILLYQHDHSKPIGRVRNVRVDKKGIFVEATVSKAAETVQSLIRDGVLKSFSVGFKIKDADYDRKNDTLVIKDLELLEISVVSVPMNQTSLFSIRKAFDSDLEYKSFKESFAKDELENVEIEEEPEEKGFKAEAVEEESEDLTSKTTVEEEEDPLKPIPFVNMLNMPSSSLKAGTFANINGDRFKINKIATASSPVFFFEECDINGKGSGNISEIDPTDINVVNYWDVDSSYDIHIVLNETKSFSDGDREQVREQFEDIVKASELDLLALKSKSLDLTLQKALNDTINLKSLSYKDWGDSHYQLAHKTCKIVEALKRLPQDDNRDKLLNVYGHNIQNTLEEKNTMSTTNTETVGDPMVVKTKASTTPTQEPVEAIKSEPATVKEPRVTELVEKTGEAMLKADAAQERAADTGTSVDPSIIEELAELRGQLKAYREQATAATTSKMIYQENQRSSAQFTDRDKANAVLVAAATNKNIFDTKLGDRMKAVLSDSNLYEGFSTDVYNEMRQQLVVAPMFRRLEVNTRTFRVPVADEDQNDYVAQFPSGSFNAGPSDITTVPTTRQATMGAVSITPQKFMTATHIAKDEEEDTIIPLVDFLRQSATNRLARGIDKAILRGDGSITSDFSAHNTLAAAGVYPSVIKGLVELAVGATLTATTGTTIDKADPSDIAAARLKLGKYGLALGENLAYITSVEGYNNLVTNTDFQTVDKFGAQATYLTGSVGAVYGIPIYISEFMDTAAASSSNLGVLVYKPGFIIGERRAMELESEYLPRQQVTAMYMSTRIDFKALTTVADAALSSRYAYAAAIVTA